jgi:hypothetical protein
MGGRKRMAANKESGITDEVLDQLLAGHDPATVFESGGLVDELKKRLAERMLMERWTIIWAARRKRTPAITTMVTATRLF